MNALYQLGALLAGKACTLLAEQAVPVDLGQRAHLFVLISDEMERFALGDQFIV